MWKKGQALVPTWTAFAVVDLMEKHFDELVDYAFTARIEDDLDAIARNERQKEDVAAALLLRRRRRAARPEAAGRGEPRRDRRRRDQHVPDRPRRRRQRDRRQARQVRPVREARRRHRQRARRPHARRAHASRRLGAAGRAEERRADRRARRLPGVRQERPLRAVRAVGRTPTTCRPGSTSRRWPACSRRWCSSGSPSTTPRSCCSCRARSASTRPTARTIIANNGRYGPYVQKGKDFRNIANEEQLLTVTLDEALEIFAQPKVFRRGGATNMAAKGPLREFGNDPVERQAGRRQGRQVRRVRHRRRNRHGSCISTSWRASIAPPACCCAAACP